MPGSVCRHLKIAGRVIISRLFHVTSQQPRKLQHIPMDNPEKNRVAKAVVDRWCSFQEALCGTKRKYPMREFLSFAEAARSYIDLTRHDQLIRRFRVFLCPKRGSLAVIIA